MVAPASHGDIDELAAGVRDGDRAAIGRAITLVESRRSGDAEPTQELLRALLPHSAGAHRVGITGVPGVGKSTLIEQLGTTLTRAGHRVAVLAVDPTSARWGGSILGDKTRMTSLANDPAAFVRPSPAAGELGGVTRVTRESILVLEAAGFDVVLVETVGVGQSETAVADMVDFFVVLMLAGAGDDLQGIKKGILEIADLIAVNKADGDNKERADAAANNYRLALAMTQPVSPTWTPPVIVCSGVTGDGLDTLWGHVSAHRRVMSDSGEFDLRRADQRVRWMHAMLDERMRARLTAGTAGLLADLEADVRADRQTPTAAADHLMAAFERTAQNSSSKATSPSMPIW
ncbi:methylmalonyl Co-A mutase-associated GTPase MeaB [Candidatus Poriferisodalis sp.]|uniref:methylmalonyl Co-A mutase-associated GTPase MeaB n=1 Tax=Candidatus Poriferisodalis sp. TaxID=3101277 RepID=UPI003B02E41D